MRATSFPPRNGRPTRSAREDRVLIYGTHAVIAALRNTLRTCYKLFATPRAIARIAPLLTKQNLSPIPVENGYLSHRLGGGATHQGLLLEAAPLSPIALEALDPTAPIVLLDQVTDPHNVGAILRTAAALGAGAVISQERHAPLAAGALAKSAAGALEQIPYLKVTNLVRCLTWFKRHGRWIIGLDSGYGVGTESVTSNEPLVLVLGAEGSGLRHLVKQQCDILYRLATPGPMKTLNVSNAAAIALYSLTARHGAIPPR